ncbi:MAG: thioredoxin family protein [Ruthenibacterium lactatiformans]
MSAFNVTKENFKTEVLEAKTPVLVDFWAPWCGYCRLIGPAVDALAAEYAGKVAVGKVNVDEQPELAEQFKVMTIPSLFVFQTASMAKPSSHRAPRRRSRNSCGRRARCNG